MERISCRSKPINSFVKIGVRPGKCRTVKSEQLVGLYLPKPFGLRGIVIFQGFAVMERHGGAKAKAEPKVPPKVDTKPGEKRKR